MEYHRFNIAMYVHVYLHCHCYRYIEFDESIPLGAVPKLCNSEGEGVVRPSVFVTFFSDYLTFFLKLIKFLPESATSGGGQYGPFWHYIIYGHPLPCNTMYIVGIDSQHSLWTTHTSITCTVQVYFFSYLGGAGARPGIIPGALPDTAALGPNNIYK